VCLSSSHIAYGSIRMEPVFMILGQSAATAASLALDGGLAVQDVDYDELAAKLHEDGQVLSLADSRGATYVRLGDLEGVVVDDTGAELQGPWRRSQIQAGVHRGYMHNLGRGDGACVATFRADLEPGVYSVELAYTAHQNRATNVPVELTCSREVHRFTVDQRTPPEGGGVFHPLGRLHLAGPVAVRIQDRDVDGHVIVDAVRFVEQR